MILEAFETGHQLVDRREFGFYGNLMFMKRIFAYILVFFFAATLNASAKTITIVQLTDVHVGCSENEKTADSLKHLNEAIDAINKRKDVNFVVFSGDNIDKSKPEDLKVFCLTAKKLKKPYYIIMGNHDAHKVAGIPKDIYMHYINLASKYQKTDDMNFQFPVTDDIQAVFLDGVVPNIPSSHGYFSEDTIKWLRKVIKQNKHKKIIIFQHFPLVPPRDEVARTVLHATEYNNLLLLNDNILLIASGHYHQGKVQTDDNGIVHISTPSLLSEAQYAVIKISYDDAFFGCPKDFKVNVEFLDVEK